MLITIRVDAVGPPSGALFVDTDFPRPFAGWLELLGILTDLLASGGESSRAAQSLRGQFHTGSEIELGEDV